MSTPSTRYLQKSIYIESDRIRSFSVSAIARKISIYSAIAFVIWFSLNKNENY
ncbi:MAG: hypothetical protein AB3A66_02825 [Nodularia sp. CChRGM 3473]